MGTESHPITVRSRKMKDSEIMWFGIRSICLFGKKKDGTNIYEERVLVFSGADENEALEKALTELKEYTKFHKTVGHPWVVGYMQDGDPLIEGYEVWSKLFETKETLDEFWESRYKKYEYFPDD